MFPLPRTNEEDPYGGLPEAAFATRNTLKGEDNIGFVEIKKPFGGNNTDYGSLPVALDRLSLSSNNERSSINQGYGSLPIHGRIENTKYGVLPVRSTLSNPEYGALPAFSFNRSEQDYGGLPVPGSLMNPDYGALPNPMSTMGKGHPHTSSGSGGTLPNQNFVLSSETVHATETWITVPRPPAHRPQYEEDPYGALPPSQSLFKGTENAYGGLPFVKPSIIEEDPYGALPPLKPVAAATAISPTLKETGATISPALRRW